MKQITCNILHVEDAVESVRGNIVSIYRQQGITIQIPEAEEIIDNLKKDGKALEIIEGYWWAANLKEAVECIDRFTSKNMVFDFVLIDRRLSDVESTRAEYEQIKSGIDKNKDYLSQTFPWYNQAAFTGDFLFLYLTLIDKVYLRNIFFITGQYLDQEDDKSLIEIWYKIADEKKDGNTYSLFENWYKEHYIKKAEGFESRPRERLLKRMSLPNAGLCNQFREGLKLFDYIDKNNTPVISSRYKNNVLNLLADAKRYDCTAIDPNDLSGLRNCLSDEIIPLMINVIPWKKRIDENGKSYDPIRCDKQDETKDEEWVYSYSYKNKENKRLPKTINLTKAGTGNFIPYNFAEALFEEAHYQKKDGLYLRRIGYLIDIIYHIQSEEIHDKGRTSKSTIFGNTYIMHTCVFAFLELSRIALGFIKNHSEYRCVL